MASVVPQPEPIHTPLVQVVPDVSAALKPIATFSLLVVQVDPALSPTATL